MIKRIKAVTGGFRPVTTATPVTESKATKIARAFKGKMGGINSAQELAYAETLSETSGLDILAAYRELPAVAPTAYPENKFLLPLVAVVPLVVYNGIIVPVNEPVVCVDSFYLYGSSRCVMRNGAISNNLHNAPKGQLRLATDEEIERLTDAQLDYFVKVYSL